MNLGSYRRLPQAQGLPMNNFQYGDVSDPSKQSTLRTQPFDGPPRAQPDQQFMTSITSASNVLPTYSLMSPMSLAMPQPNMWDDSIPMTQSFEDQNNSYYGYSSPFTGDNEGSFSRGVEFGVPRFVPSDMNGSGFNDNSMLDAYEPSAYITDSARSSHQHVHTDRPNIIFNGLDNSREFARLSISRSPLPKHENDDMCGDPLSFERGPAFRLPSSEASDDGGLSSREMTVVDGDDHNTEEPYAKLIHRALMSAPNHSMVLQEIYQWFRENTSKGNSESKGWMNSIRHNLSMNAAFKKTERKVAGDETKKSTEWVLEDFAIREGVQSTTRYRKGTGAKKFIKNDHPAAARQASGRRGGYVTSSLNRRSGKEILRTRKSTQTIGRAARQEFQHQSEISRNERRISPLTPPSAERHPSGPYFFSKSSQDLLESPYDPDNFGLGDVQGVYLDGPLFSNDPVHENPHFGHSFPNQRFG